MATEMYKTLEDDDNKVVQKLTLHTCCNFYYLRNKFRRQQVNKLHLLQIYNMAVYSTNHFRNMQMPSNNKQLLNTTCAGPAIKPHLYNPAVQVDQVIGPHFCHSSFPLAPCRCISCRKHRREPSIRHATVSSVACCHAFKPIANYKLRVLIKKNSTF
jgi:hypothetical protein